MSDLKDRVMRAAAFDERQAMEKGYSLALRKTGTIRLNPNEFVAYQTNSFQDGARWTNARLTREVITPLIELCEKMGEALGFVSMPITSKSPTVESLLETIANDDARAKEALALRDEFLKGCGG